MNGGPLPTSPGPRHGSRPRLQGLEIQGPDRQADRGQGVTLVDDRTIAAFPRSYAFDDEGTPSSGRPHSRPASSGAPLPTRSGARSSDEVDRSGAGSPFRYPPIPRWAEVRSSTKAPSRGRHRGRHEARIYYHRRRRRRPSRRHHREFHDGVGEAYLMRTASSRGRSRTRRSLGMASQRHEVDRMVGDDLEPLPERRPVRQDAIGARAEKDADDPGVRTHPRRLARRGLARTSRGTK